MVLAHGITTAPESREPNPDLDVEVRGLHLLVGEFDAGAVHGHLVAVASRQGYQRPHDRGREATIAQMAAEAPRWPAIATVIARTRKGTSSWAVVIPFDLEKKKSTIERIPNRGAMVDLCRPLGARGEWRLYSSTGRGKRSAAIEASDMLGGVYGANLHFRQTRFDCAAMPL